MFDLFLLVWIIPIIWFLLEFVILDLIKKKFSLKTLSFMDMLWISIPLFGFILMCWCILDEWFHLY